MDTWKQTTIDRLAKELVRLAKSYEKDNWDEMDKEEKKEYGSFKNYMSELGLDSALDAGLFAELEEMVVDAARDLV